MEIRLQVDILEMKDCITSSAIRVKRNLTYGEIRGNATN